MYKDHILLNAAAAQAHALAKALDNPDYLSRLGPLYAAQLQIRIQAWERVLRAEEALAACFVGMTDASLGIAHAKETLLALRKEAAYLGADYYDCDDSEQLQHETVEEAIHSFLDGFGDSWRDAIARLNPIEVKAYTRKQVEASEILNWAEGLVEGLEYSFSGEYGPPDDPPFKDEVKEMLRIDLQAAIARAVKATHIWQCEVVGTREYSQEELLDMFKAEIEKEEKDG